MATLEQLGDLLPVTVELELFDYVALAAPREPPAIDVCACLARGYTDDEQGEQLRLAFVTGHPIDSQDLLVLAYLWREGPRGVVWGAERWSSPERRLRPYRQDPAFRPRAAGAVHAELQRLDDEAFADHVRAVLAGPG